MLNTETTATGLIVLTDDAGVRIATIEYDTKRGRFCARLDEQFRIGRGGHNAVFYAPKYYRSMKAAEYQVLAWHEELKHRPADFTKLEVSDIVNILDESGYTDTGIVATMFVKRIDMDESADKFMYATKWCNDDDDTYGRGAVYVWCEADGTVKADF